MTIHEEPTWKTNVKKVDNTPEIRENEKTQMVEIDFEEMEDSGTNVLREGIEPPKVNTTTNSNTNGVVGYPETPTLKASACHTTTETTIKKDTDISMIMWNTRGPCLKKESFKGSKSAINFHQ